MKVMLVYVAVLAGVALSAVVQQPLHKRSVLRRNPNTNSGRSGYKTGRGPQRALAASAGSGSQAISDYYDEIYLTNITIGTPGQTLSVVVDTVVSNTYVIGDTCTSQVCAGTPDLFVRNRFNTTKTSTLKWMIEIFVFALAGGAAEGVVAIDTVSLGGFTNDAQPFGVMSQLPDSFMYHPGDGILGLGWPNDMLEQSTPVVTNLLPQFDQPLFTIWLDRHALPLEHRLAGLITYGALDPVNCDAQVNYVTLSTKNAWQFAMNNFQVGGFSLPRSQQAVSNTADSFIGAPPAAFNAVISATGATYDSEEQFYMVPCKGDHPELVFTIGGNTYSVPGSEYIISIGRDGGKCALMLYAQAEGSGFSASWTLGLPFIRTFCHVYDMGNARIGFARAHHKQR